MSHLQSHPALTIPQDAPTHARRGSLTAGVYAAFIQALAAAASLFGATVLIGLTALSDSSRLVELALHNPAPLLLQDGLKFVSAATSVVLIVVLFMRLRTAAPRTSQIAALFGLLATALLLVNATLSLSAVTQAMRGLPVEANASATIGLLGLAAIAANGVWYLLVSWTAQQAQRLPTGLCWLGLAMGILSLIPFLAILVVTASVIWAFWLGMALWRAQ